MLDCTDQNLYNGVNYPAQVFLEYGLLKNLLKKV
jgi:hypothetical protein